MHYLRRDHFTCLISIDISSGDVIELEFPLKHMNLLPSRKKWQFETGPILFLKANEIETLHELEAAMLLPCFVHGNRFDRVDFFPDFPFPREYSPWSRNVKSRTRICRVQLFGTNEIA